MKHIFWFFLIFCICLGCSLICDEPSSFANIKRSDVEKNCPVNLSWADIDLNNDGVFENYVTGIKDQPCADCYLYAAVGALEIQYHIDHGVSVSLDLSEQNLHNCMRLSCEQGMPIHVPLEYIQKYGVLENTYVKTGEWGVCDNCKQFVEDGLGPVPIESVPFFSFHDEQVVTTPDMSFEEKRIALVAALQGGPVVVHVGSWLGYERNGNFRYCVEDRGGDHAVVVIGYRNHGEAFLVKNSHGEGQPLTVIYNGSEKCEFALKSRQIVPGTTYSKWGMGESFCYSKEDRDADGVPDAHDNCPLLSNIDQYNSDGDMFGDICDPCPAHYDEFTGFYCDTTLFIDDILF